MNFILTVTLSLLAFAQAPIHLTHEQHVAILHEAQIAYDLGVTLQASEPSASMDSFQRAANRYQLLIDDGIVNGKLWYNLGNSYLQANEIGKSIAAYRSAQRYIPTNRRVEANLQYARSLVNNPVALDDTTSLLRRIMFWHRSVSTQVRINIAVVLWSIFWVVLIIRNYVTFHGFKLTAISAGCAAIAFGISVGADMTHQHQGVVISTEVIVRKGNGTNYAPMFQQPIHEGIEFEIIEERAHWLHIRLPNGAQGWIQEDDAMIVSLELQREKLVS